ncbi:hypothetical protein J3R30DRAFT_3442662 [Lentinula aciculospora]|uniref:Myb-like domain-containing protein n=1 Tax=Lentinula aciculospora TaxID=153920 RepID=A0A9W9DTI9_9AGAR|nr:hypothetical protein J3R30DRAFT_3442662 [Lentinula aciculospora]
MTSRVQKGGPVFRPLARQKSRPAAVSQGPVSRQPSVVAEQEQSTPSLPSLTAPASLQVIPEPSFILPNAFDAPCPAPKPVVVPTVAPSVSMLPPTLNYTSSYSHAISTAMSHQGVPPPLPPSIAPTIPSVISTPSQPPLQPKPNTIIPLTQSSASLPPSGNVLHNSVTENTFMQPTPRSALNVENHNKPSHRGDSNATGEPVVQYSGPDENGEDVSDDNDAHYTSKGAVKQRRPRRSITRNITMDEEGSTVEARPKRRKRTAKGKGTSNDDVNDDVQKPRRKRRRKSRSPSLPPLNPDADPGEDIDPTVVTMASLCSDTGQGRVSSKAQEILNNHATWKASNRERRARMKIMMERKKYGQPEDEDAPVEISTSPNPAPVTPAAESSQSRQPSPPMNNPSASTAAANADLDSFDYSQNLTASRFNVQVRIGPNGETIIDEESLVVDRADDAENETSEYTHVIESDRSKFINSSTYGTKLRGTRWSVEETELFYEALSQYGENYELISYVLPGRDRKSCKNKFRAEDKKNPARINFSLNNSVPVDIATLSRMTGRDFSGPTPEIAMSRPAEPATSSSATAQIEAGPSGSTGVHDKHREKSSSKSRKRSRSRTAGPAEDGLMVIGDLDTFVDHGE